MAKKILITGSAGFVGHHFVEHILENTDWHITNLISLKHRGDSMRLQNLKNDTPERVRYIYHDLNGPISERMMSYIGDINYVVNFASESHVDRSIENPVPFIQNNVNLILNILEYVRQVRPNLFIQISTDEVYGPAVEPECHKEWSPIVPSNPYAASKAAQEAIAISYWRTYDIPLILTNTMNMFGERQDIEKYIPKIIKSIYDDKTLTIHGNKNYIGKRFYLHARNLSDACLFLLKRESYTKYIDTIGEVIKPDRFNIVGEKELDNLELAKIIGKLMRKPVFKYELVDFHTARPGHDRRYALDGDAIRKIGWKAPISFENSLDRTIRWTLDHLREGWI